MVNVGSEFRRLWVAPRRADGAPKYRYPVDALELGVARLVVHGVFGNEIARHSERLGFFPGDHTIEYYTVGRWSNTYAVLSPDGVARGFYCNLGTPPVLAGSEIVYSDLDLDVLVRAHGAVQVLDTDEYEARAATLAYSPEMRRLVEGELATLRARVERREPPFDGVEPRALLARVLPHLR